MRLSFLFALALGLSASAQTINPNQIRGGSKNVGQIMTSLNNVGAWTSGAQIPVTLYASCTDNSADDDSVGINLAIAAANSLGGGAVVFPSGSVCLIKNPIYMQSGVVLVGPGAPDLINLSGAASIQAGANMAAMITQPNFDTALTTGIYNLSIFGNSAHYTIPNLISLSAQFSVFANNTVSGGTGNCMSIVEPTGGSGGNFAWVNTISGGSFSGCSGYGITTNETDSTITNAYVTGNGSGQILSYGSGNIGIIGGQVELSPSGTYGIELRTTSLTTGCSTVAFPYTISGVRFSQNYVDQKYTYYGGCTAPQNMNVSSTGNIYNGTYTTNILIDSLLQNGFIFDNFANSNPPDGNISWGSTAVAGWVVGGTSALENNQRFVNLPVDTVVMMGGAGGQQVQLGPYPFAPLLYGSVTLSGGSATYTFPTAYTSAPHCTATDTTAAEPVQASSSTTVLTLTGTGTDVINFSCPGGS